MKGRLCCNIRRKKVVPPPKQGIAVRMLGTAVRIAVFLLQMLRLLLWKALDFYVAIKPITPGLVDTWLMPLIKSSRQPQR